LNFLLAAGARMFGHRSKKVLGTPRKAKAGLRSWLAGGAAAIGLLAGGAAANPTVGAWGPYLDWGLIPLHSVALPDGRVLGYGSDAWGYLAYGEAYAIFDPTLGPTPSNTWTPPAPFPGPNRFTDPAPPPGPFVKRVGNPISPSATDIFCTGQLVLAATGQTALFGGDNFGDAPFANRRVNMFDETTDALTDAGLQMSLDRWYPTVTTLQNGDVLIQGGTLIGSADVAAITPEVYSPVTGLRLLSGATSAAIYGGRDANGNLVDQRGDYGWWYPKSWVNQSGRVYSITGRFMYSIDPTGVGTITTHGIVPLEQPSAPFLDNPWNTGSTAVRLSPTRAMMIGGAYAESATRATAFYDFPNTGSGTPSYSTGPNMQFRRYWHTASLLADGRVAVTGGSMVANLLERQFNPTTQQYDGPIVTDSNGNPNVMAYNVELYNPNTNAWTTGPAEGRTRLYHSTATLLRDGSLLSAGGGSPGPHTQRNGQIYYPPYLYSAPGVFATRPQVLGGPTNFRLGQPFALTVASGNTINRVTLVKLSGSTHGVNFEQSFHNLSFTQTGTTLTISPPPTSQSGYASPGFYYLFAFNSAGTPSMARIMYQAPPVRSVLADGGFEQFQPQPATTRAFAGGTTLGGWTVGGGGVTLVRNTANGFQGSGAAGIVHTDLGASGSVRRAQVGLSPNATYELRLRYSAASTGARARAQAGTLNQAIDVRFPSGSREWLNAVFKLSPGSAVDPVTLTGLVANGAGNGVLVDDVQLVRSLTPVYAADGGFETARIMPSFSKRSFLAGEQIGGWTVEQGAVDLIQNRLESFGAGGAEGNQHIDLFGTGASAGRVAQEFVNLVPGRTYRLQFRYARSPYLATGRMRIEVAGLNTTLTALNAGPSSWITATYTFTASASRHTLRLTSLEGTISNMLVDAVTVNPI
jgi:hypothetical protein